MTDEKHHFPCDACGSDMRFDPASSQLVCDHCGNTRAMAENEGPWDGPPVIRELDFATAIRNELATAEIEETRVVTCPSCGAQTEVDEATQATECPFCATPVVTDTGTHRHIKPKGVLPFALKEEEARDAMKKWLGRLWFAPNGLKTYARKGRRMNGIYVPYWTYDADTTTRYRGERGDDYYVTRTVMRNGKRETVRERRTRWSRRSGTVARFFDDVLVLASRSLPKSYTDGLEPWDLKELQPYRPAFLAGFRAEGYTLDLDEGYDEARAKMAERIKQDIRRDIGGDRQRIHDMDTDVRDVTFKHVLLPVWMAAYKYNGKSYRFVVNARTGKVQGERPWSVWKIAFAVVVALIVAGVVFYFGQDM